MKKIFSVLIILVIFLTLTACNKYEDYTFELKEDGTYEIDKYIGEVEYGKELIIPSSYKGKEVTSIGVSAFRSNQSLRWVTIPESVKVIENLAFAECSGLQAIVIPKSVVSINYYAFYKCINLLNVDLPENVSLGEGVFRKCENLKNIIIPEGVKTIYRYTFGECTNLETVIIPTSVETLFPNAFSDSSKVTICVKTETIPEGWAQEYKDGRFPTILGFISYGVTEDKFEYGISKINDEYFASIVGYVQGKDKDTSISIPNIIEGYNVKRIAGRAFNNLHDLISISIPEGVERIESRAFHECWDLESLIIPESVKYVGYFVFSFTDKVKIKARSKSQPEGWDEEWNCYNRPVYWGYKGE